ncbi:MAG: Gfo/Idh/MocA family oxidoreductase [Cyanobacteria bacterium]|nr:Gfo/Idh/MocA family oxidoreductase [Cyanobacteriota bacterium]
MAGAREPFERKTVSRNFAMTGVAGFVAPRHLKAIKETGNRLIAAVDPHDAVGVLDRFWFNARFFTEIERFDRHLEKLHRGPEAERVHYLSICSPNYLHDAHIRMALRSGADAICEKPLVINPWNLDALQDIERETGKRVYTVLQLRLHPDLIALKKRLDAEQRSKPHQVSLTYITARGPWYDVSWKGREDRSGGLVTNIGIHFFDLLIWLFGAPKAKEMHLREEKRIGGWIELERAEVSWFLSAESTDLPFEAQPGVKTTFRSITVDGQEIEFSEGFTDLHTRVYEEMLAGRGFGIDAARPSIELTSEIRQTPVADHPQHERHPRSTEVS